MTGKKTSKKAKPATVFPMSPALKGTLKDISGSRSDYQNNILANQTGHALWLKHAKREMSPDRNSDPNVSHPDEVGRCHPAAARTWPAH